MKNTAKRQGTPAAAWFYAQPGFHSDRFALADHTHECRDCGGTINCYDEPCRWEGGNAGCSCAR